MSSWLGVWADLIDRDPEFPASPENCNATAIHSKRQRPLPMTYAISLKCTNETAAAVLTLWDEAAAFEQVPSMRALNYPPHITFAVYDECPWDRPEVILDDVFAAQPTLSVDFSGIGHFPNERLVLWARPVANADLLRLHAALHRQINPTACHAHYRPGTWVPHCSLATRVPPAQSAAALDWARRRRMAFSIRFDAADCVRFPPVDVLTETRLASK